MLCVAEAGGRSTTPRDIRVRQVEHDIVEQFVSVDVTYRKSEIEDGIECGVRFGGVEFVTLGERLGRGERAANSAKAGAGVNVPLRQGKSASVWTMLPNRTSPRSSCQFRLDSVISLRHTTEGFYDTALNEANDV